MERTIDTHDGPARHSAAAALLGMVVGYFLHRQWPELDWFLWLLTGWR